MGGLALGLGPQELSAHLDKAIARIKLSMSRSLLSFADKLSAPRTITRKALSFFLHECAHFALHAEGKRRKRYLEEMQAEQRAHARMRENRLQSG
jgi:hypothetical protein